MVHGLRGSDGEYIHQVTDLGVEGQPTGWASASDIGDNKELDDAARDGQWVMKKMGDGGMDAG